MQEHFDDRLDTWAAEFAEAPEARAVSAELRELSRGILAAFLRGATHAGADLSDIGEEEVRRGLLEHVARLALSSAQRREIPELVASFLTMLGRQGRIAQGMVLAARARALAGAFQSAQVGNAHAQTGSAHAQTAPATPIRRGYSKLGPNDLCPCGSGKKWKKCCKRAFEPEQ